MRDNIDFEPKLLVTEDNVTKNPNSALVVAASTQSKIKSLTVESVCYPYGYETRPLKERAKAGSRYYRKLLYLEAKRQKEYRKQRLPYSDSCSGTWYVDRHTGRQVWVARDDPITKSSLDEKGTRVTQRDSLGAYYSEKFSIQSGESNFTPLLDLFPQYSNDELWKLLESFGILGAQLYKSTDVTSVLLAILAFIKGAFNYSLVDLLRTYNIKEIVSELMKDDEEDDLRVQAYSMTDFQENIEAARHYVDRYQSTQKCPLFKKINRVLIFITAIVAFKDEDLKMDKDSTLRLEGALYRDGVKLRLDTIHSILDLIVFLCEKGIEVVASGKVECIFHSESAYEKWYDESCKCISQSKFLTNPEPHGIDIHTFSKKINELIAQGKVISRYAADIDGKAKSIVKNMVLSLEGVIHRCINLRCSQETRRAPLALVLEGDTGVGKTTFSDILHTYYGSVRQKDISLGSRYMRVAGAKFWDGFSTHQWSLLLDDVAFAKPGVTKDMDPTLSELIQIINNAPYCPDKASLEEKGNAPFQGELVVVTTNSPKMHLHHYYAVPSAAARRTPYHIRLSIKPEYCVENSHMLDSNKVPANVVGQYLDIWNIDIYDTVLGDLEERNKEHNPFLRSYTLVKKETMTMIPFLKWLHGLIVEHNEKQDKIVDTSVVLRATSICVKCSIPTGMCNCGSDEVYKPIVSDPLKVQNGVMMETFFFMFRAFVVWGAMYVGAVFGEAVTQFLIERSSRMLMRCITGLIKMFFYFLFKDVKIRARKIVRKANVVCSYVGEKINDCYDYTSRERIRLLARCVRIRFFSLSTFATSLCAAAVACISLIVAYKMTHSVDDLNPQGGTQSHETRPTGNERESVWYNDNFEVSHMDLGRQSISWKQLNKTDLVEKLSQSIHYMRCKEPGAIKWLISNVVSLGGQRYLTTSHTIPTGDTVECEFFSKKTVGISVNCKFTLKQSQISRMGEICIFTMHRLPPRRDITDLFVRREATSFKGDGLLISRDSTGSILTRKVSGVSVQNFEIFGKMHACFAGLADQVTIDGDCGSILVLETNMGPVIGGIHIMGSPRGKIVSLIVTHDKVFDERDFVPNKPNIDTSANRGELVELHKKSPARYIENGTAAIYGSFSGFKPTPKSTVCKTVICDAMEKRGYSLKHGKPIMRGWEPWYRHLSEAVREKGFIDCDILRNCADAMYGGWISGLTKQDFKELQVYDLYTAINGAPGVRFVDGINRKTSAGYPWSKSKRYLLSPDEMELEHNPDAVKVDDSVKERVDKIEECYMNRQRYSPIFTGSLKDEARKFSKIKENNTRVFNGGSLDFTLIMRKNLLSAIRLIQRKKYIFEAAPGTEAQSCEWDYFYKYLTQHGVNQIVAGDFKDYDISLMPELLLEAFNLLIRLHIDAGCCEEQITMLEGIKYDVVYAFVEHNGDLIEFFGINPSGQSLTTILNSLCNSLLLRYCYYVNNPEKECKSFKSNVALMTYGDDNIMGVSQRTPWYNHTSIQAVFKTLNIVYTMAEKEAKSVPYINMDDATFLKRKWRFEPELNKYVCPLEMDSIIRSLMIGTRSKYNSDKVQITQIMHSANDEFFWYGRGIFEKYHQMLIDITKECDLIVYFDHDLMTFEQLLDRYKRNSELFEKDPVIDKFVVCESDDLKIQSRTESILCHHCNKAHCLLSDESFTRICLVCSTCRWLGYDIDCPHCGVNDCCESCGILTPWIKRSFVSNSGNYYPFVCEQCEYARRERELRRLHTQMCQCDDYHIQSSEMDVDEPKHLHTLKHVANTLRLVGDRGHAVRNSLLQLGPVTLSVVCNTCEKPIRSTAPCKRSERRPTQRDGLGCGQYQFVHMVGDEIYHIQSAVESVESSSRMDNSVGVSVVSETATFMDANLSEMFNFPADDASGVNSDMLTNVDLGGFLNRPTLIATYSWVEGGFSATNFDPWTLFLNSTPIKSKLNNFAFLRGNLKIKIVVNASPFYYGALLFAYTPTSYAHPIPAYNNQLVPWSQRPHVWIYPKESNGAEMTLPFIYHRGYVNVTSAADVATLGSMRIQEYVQLASANGATTNGVTLQVYAWMENETLTAATAGLALQAGSEYAECGVVSGPATAIAKAASYLGKIPVIGKFARATEIGSSAIAHIAGLFGWSNVMNLVGVQPVKNLPFHDISSAHISDCGTKFTLDPKAEVSVDPSIVGGPNTDELTIASIVQRESYLATSTWATSDTIGTLKFSSMVTPNLYDRMVYDAGSLTYLTANTPMSHVGQLFRHWRGDIIFRFKIVCSQFHRGRLRITWDPISDITATTDYTNVVFTKIVDLGETDEVEFRVPYMQSLAWCNVGDIISANAWSTTVGQTPNADYVNGTLTLRVLTNLSAPIDTATVSIMTFVRGADNLEFANPRDLASSMSHYAIQGATEPVQSDSHEDVVEPFDKGRTPFEERYLVNFGESIPSLRVLLRRTTFLDALPLSLNTITATDKTGMFQLRQTRMPSGPGYNTNAFCTFYGRIATGTPFYFVCCAMTPLAWIAPAFLCYRGSIRWKYNLDNAGSSVPHTILVKRNVGTLAANQAYLEGSYTQIVSSTGGLNNFKSAYRTFSTVNGNAGMFLTNPDTQAGVNVEMPYMTKYRYSYARPSYALLGTSVDGTDEDTYVVQIMVHPSAGVTGLNYTLERFVSIGTDFNLYMYLNAPSVYSNAGLGTNPV